MSDKLKKRIIKTMWILALGPFALLILLIMLANWGAFGTMPTFEELENPQSKLATEIYSSDNELLGTFHLENRTHVEYSELSPNLVKALIATEDARFIGHSGIDYIGMGRVFFKTVILRNKRGGGGSTITQQLALNLFSSRSDNKIKRVLQKLQEWVTAVKLERRYTKSEIVTMYFNTVDFGSNAYGIRSAAQTFFGKLPSELNLQESALMVGVVNAPSRYSPVQKDPSPSLKRRNVVLSQMKKYNYISSPAFDSVKNTPLILNYRPVSHNTGPATYFREMLKQTMRMNKPALADYKYRAIEEFRADSILWADNPIYGWCNKNLKNGKPYNLDRDGLKIYTTIDSRMQKYAEDAVEEHLSKVMQPNFDVQKKNRKNFPFSNIITSKEIESSVNRAIRSSDRFKTMKKADISEDSIMRSFNTKQAMTLFKWNEARGIDTIISPRDSIMYYKSILRAAFMAMDPQTGSIRAYVGGPNFRHFKYDNVRQSRRQIGSTIKPFLYTLALQEGMSPCDQLINNTQFVPLPEGGFWSPKSTEKAEYLGKTVTLKWGLAMSSNNISAILIQRFSPEALIELCHSMGIFSYMEPTPSVCLGSSDASLFQMVSAFNTYPNEGFYVEPLFVTRIEDNNGNVLETFTKMEREVISKQIAYASTMLMRGVVDYGTGNRAKRLYLTNSEIAGKTGTTSNNSDGWFIGYVPKLTAGVWVGNEDRGSYLLGDGARGALPIWGIFMKKVTEDKSININADDKFIPPVGFNAAAFSCPPLPESDSLSIHIYDDEEEDNKFFQ